MKLTRSVLIVIESLALLCLSSLLFGQKIEIQKEGGVTVVYNPRIPVPLDGFSTQAILKEELIIGEESDKEDYWFSYLNYLKVYCTLEDEDGVPLVKRYAIKWKEKIGSKPLSSNKEYGQALQSAK